MGSMFSRPAPQVATAAAVEQAPLPPPPPEPPKAATATALATPSKSGGDTRRRGARAATILTDSIDEGHLGG